MPIDFSKVELDASNPEPRCPCILLLDTSGSMGGDPIHQLNQGLTAFQEALNQDPLAQLRVEVSVITFGDSVQIQQDFITANQFTPSTLTASGLTPMGEAINLALDQIESRKQNYRQNGLSYYRPWIFLVTDGGPTDGELWKDAAQRIHNEESYRRVAFFSVGVAGADFSVLQQLSSRQPLQLQGLNFREMFVWLSSSLTTVSHSRPDEEVPLQSPLGWGTV